VYLVEIIGLISNGIAMGCATDARYEIFFEQGLITDIQAGYAECRLWPPGLGGKCDEQAQKGWV